MKFYFINPAKAEINLLKNIPSIRPIARIFSKRDLLVIYLELSVFKRFPEGILKITRGLNATKGGAEPPLGSLLATRLVRKVSGSL